MLNKKSQIEDLLPLLFVIIAIVLLALLFSFRDTNRTRQAKEYADSQITTQDSKELLIKYFESPFAFNDMQNTNIADAINIYFLTYDKNIMEQVNIFSIGFFSSSYLESEGSSWSLEMENTDGKTITIEPEKSKTIYTLRKEMTNILIPTYHNGKYINVKLFQTYKSDNTLNV